MNADLLDLQKEQVPRELFAELVWLRHVELDPEFKIDVLLL